MLERAGAAVRLFQDDSRDGLPKSFETDVTDEMIRAVKLVNKIQRSYMEDILRQAEKNGIADSWVGAVRDLLAKRL